MSDGRAHNKATVKVAGIYSVVLLAATQKPIVAIFAGLGCLSGMILTPDLDVDGGSRANYNAGRLWFLFWKPYAKIIPHRHFLSHFPIVGTLGRLAYSSILLFILYYSLTALMTWWLPLSVDDKMMYAGAAILGLASSDIIHFLMDELSPKRQRRPYAKKTRSPKARRSR